MRTVLASWVLLAGCDGQPFRAETDPAGAARPADDPLADPDFRFCHELGEDADEIARDWCGWVDDPVVQERCPALVETCQKGLTSATPRGCEGSSSYGEDGDVLGRPERPDPRPLACDGLPAPAGAMELVRWTMALAVAAIVLVLLRLAVSSFGRRPSAVPASIGGGALPAVDEPLPDLPSADLLSGARAALAANRPGEAVLLARGAALRRLGEAGRLHLHRSRTDREYQRQLRGDVTLQVELRSIFSAVESLRWGGRPLDRTLAEGVLQAAERIVAALAGVWLVAWCVAAPSARAAGYEPNGDAALAEVFDRYGYDIGWRLTSLDGLDQEIDVLVLDVQHGVLPSEDQWTLIQEWVSAGGVLVTLGDVSGRWEELGSVAFLARDATLVLDPAFGGAGLAAPRWPGVPAWGYDGACRALVGTEGGAAPICLIDQGAGAVIAVADPRVFRNAGFAQPDNVAFVGELVYVGQSVEGWPVGAPPRVQLATRMATRDAGDDRSNPLTSLADSGLLPFLLQLLATWGLAMLWRGWPFAPLRDPPEVGRVGFAEHVRALGTRWFRRRESGFAYHRLAQLWVARAGREGLISAARRAGYPADAARDWVQHIERVAATAPPADRGDVERMEELWRVTCHLR